MNFTLSNSYSESQEKELLGKRQLQVQPKLAPAIIKDQNQRSAVVRKVESTISEIKLAWDSSSLRMVKLKQDLR